MRVTVKKVGDQYVLFVEANCGPNPAGERLYKANHPQHPFPKHMRFDDPDEAMNAAEALTDYLEHDAKRKPNRKKRQ